MPKTLLLADDSVVIQKLVALSFANEDVELITTDNGDDAIIRAQEVQPDLVLADVVMPGKNGYEVCEAIRQDPQLGGIPVVLLTGTFEAFDADRAQAVESDGHITKPFEAQALVDRVNELLARGKRAPSAAAAPAAAAAPPEAPMTAADATPEYDFFDESSDPNIDAGLGTSAAPAVAAQDDSFAFGEPEAELEAGALPPLASPSPIAATPVTEELPPLDGNDHTVAIVPEDGDDFGDSLMPDAPSVETAIPGDVDNALSGPTDPLGIGRVSAADDPLADMDFGAASEPSPDPQGRDLSASDLSFGTHPPPAAPANDPGETLLADDLFSGASDDATRIAANPADSFSLGPDEGFAFDMGSPATPNAPADTHEEPDPLMQSGELLGGTSSEIPREGSSAWDVSSSDLGDSLDLSTPGAPTNEPGETIVASDFAAAPVQTPPASEAPTFGESAPSASERGDSRKPDLSPMMRERIHETLEKVAWEAFADVSDTIVREVLKRVESVAWEVIPQMAEAMIQEEIRRMKDETD